MIAWVAIDFVGDFITNVANEVSNPLKETFDSCAAVYVPDLRVISLATPGTGALTPDLSRSDHAPFWFAGYQALMLTDGANFRNPNYHESTDNISTLDFEFMTNVVKATLATAAKLADPIHASAAISEAFALGDLISGTNHDPEFYGFELAPNFPNPFNPSTQIRYHLPMKADISLAIFDINGKKIADLYQGAQLAGTYTVNWEAQDMGGTALPSGMYLVRLQVDQAEAEMSYPATLHQRMILLREGHGH